MKSSSQKNSVVVFDAQARTWRLLCAPSHVISTARPEEVVACMQEVEALVSTRGLIAAGFVAYEAAPAFDAALRVQGDTSEFPLLWFGLYEQWSEYAFENRERNNGIDPVWQADIDEAEYRRCITQVQRYISAGDTYQVNYSYRRRAEFSGEGWPLFCRLASLHQPEFGAYLHIGDWEVLSLSPELFFTRKGKLVTSIPMKGTMARGLSSLDDAAQGKRLQACCKNRAENVMIVDMVRNDLGRIAVPGSVRVDELFALRRYPTLWQMVSSVSGEVDVSLAEIFTALFPAASITGAPKARTMELIAELEATPRRLYTGSIGFLLPDGRAQFNVAIRTMLHDRFRQRLEYGVGGGVVADSSAVSEWHETQVKSLVCHRQDPEFSLLETMRWSPEEGLFLLEYHLQRLEESARYFDYPYRAETVRKLLRQTVADWSRGSRKLRLLINRQGQVRIEDAPLEPQLTAKPVRLGLAGEAVELNNRFLYHKTTLRDLYTQARATGPAQADDVLLYNQNGELTETTIANVVVTLQGRRYTPPVCCGLLPGTYRQYLLDRGEITERVLKLDCLRKAEAITLINSVRGERAALCL